MYGWTRMSSMCWFGAKMKSTTKLPVFSSLLVSYTSLEEISTNLEPLFFWWWITPWKYFLRLPNEFSIDMRYHLFLLLIDAEVVSNLLPLFERCRHLLSPPPGYHSQLWNYLHRWETYQFYSMHELCIFAICPPRQMWYSDPWHDVDGQAETNLVLRFLCGQVGLLTIGY